MILERLHSSKHWDVEMPWAKSTVSHLPKQQVRAHHPMNMSEAKGLIARASKPCARISSSAITVLHRFLPSLKLGPDLQVTLP